jgi:hypothetical protein
VSVTDLTIRAAAVAGLAIVALLLTGWRKTARAIPRSARGGHGTNVVRHHVVRAETPEYHAPNVARRLVMLLAGGGLTVVVGVVLATIIGFATAIVVTTLTDLLKS